MKSSWVRRNCLRNLHNDANGYHIGRIGKVKSQTPIWECGGHIAGPSGRSGKRKKYNARFNKGLTKINQVDRIYAVW